MPKSSVLPINYHSIQLPLDLKKAILFFDNIVIEEESLKIAKEFAGTAFEQGGDRTDFDFNIQNIEFLAEQELLSFESLNNSIAVSINTPEAEYMKLFADELESVNRLTNALILESEKRPILVELMDKFKELPNHIARAISIRLNNEGKESFPIFESEPNYKEGKKEQVLKFVFSQLPTPSDDVPWEQVLEFKNKSNVVNKYFALIDWVNKVSKKELSLTEIEDEYRALYYEYAEQYRIHSIKHKQTTIEVFVNAVIDVLGGPLGTSSINTSLFSLFRRQMNLLEAESKFSGKEIAYVFKANQVF